MPQFERFTSTRKVDASPGSKIDPSVLGDEGRALQELGSAGQKFAGVLMDIEKKKRQTREINQFYERVNGYRRQHAQAMSNIRKSNLTSDEFKAAASKATNDLAGLMDTSDLSSEIAGRVKREVMKTTTDAHLAIGRESDKMFRGEQRELFVRNLPDVEDEVVRSDSPESFVEALEKHEIFIANNVGFAFPPEEARNVAISSRKRIFKRRGEIKIKGNPYAALRSLDKGQDAIPKDGDFAEFKEMRPGMFQDMKDLARAEVIRLESASNRADAKREKAEAKFQDRILTELQSRSVRSDQTETILKNKDSLGPKFDDAIRFNNAMMSHRTTGKKSDQLTVLKYNIMARTGFDPDTGERVTDFQNRLRSEVVDGNITGAHILSLSTAHTARLDKQRTEGKTVRNQHVGQGLRTINTAMKTAKKFGLTDPNAQRLTAMAQTEFFTRVIEEPKLHPLEIANEITQRYLKELRQSPDPNAIRRAGGLENKTVSQVLQERREGMIGYLEADRQIEILNGLENLEEAAAKRKEKIRLQDEAIRKERENKGWLSWFNGQPKTTPQSAGKARIRK